MSKPVGVKTARKPDLGALDDKPLKDGPVPSAATEPAEHAPSGAVELPKLTGRVVGRNDPGYAEARLDYNLALAAAWPSLVVFAQTAEDVQNAVRYARQNNIQFLARSGRHSYEGYSVADNVMVIDVSEMDHVRVLGSGSDRTVQIGAGAVILDVYEKLYQVGLTINGGSCPTVGIVGLTLGGGLGLLQREYGLTIDRLKSVTLIDVNGDKQTYDSSDTTGAFWAHQGGGGGNFGIVTELEFFPVEVSTVSIFQVTWSMPVDVAGDATNLVPNVLQGYINWLRSSPDVRITPILKIAVGTDNGTPGQLILFGQINIPQLKPSDVMSFIKPMTSINNSAVSAIQIQADISFMTAVDFMAGVGPSGPSWAAHWHGDSNTFKDTSALNTLSTLPKWLKTQPGHKFPPAIETVIKFMTATMKSPFNNRVFQMDGLGGRFASVPPTATAFPWRNAVFSIQYQSYWQAPGGLKDDVWVDEFRKEMESIGATEGAYVNYLDKLIGEYPHTDLYLAKYYGPNAKRLQNVKYALDPHEYLRFPQFIPALAPTDETTPPRPAKKRRAQSAGK